MKIIKFTAKQRQMLTLPQRTWNIFTGAVRSGKSYGSFFRVPSQIMSHYTEPCLIVGKTLATIERNVLRPLRNIYGQFDIGEIKGRADGGRYVVLWGKEVDCVGANDERSISKIHGAEYGYAYCDELTLYPENFFRMLESRLSLPNSQCDATCNPESPSHYIKQFIDSDAFKAYGNSLHFTIYDNEYLPREYVKRLEDEYRNTIYFDRWILGNWVKAEGLVFPLFNRGKHYLTPDEFASRYGRHRIIRVIFGVDGATTRDSTAIIPLAILDNGQSVTLQPFYHNPKMNGQLANEQLMPYILKYFEDLENEYKFTRTGTQFYTPVDCAAADLCLMLNYHLPDYYNVHSFGKKDLLRTVDIVNNAFARNAIHILDFGGYYNYMREQKISGVSQLVVDLELMVWDDNGKDFDDSVPNDCADAFRYAVCAWYTNPDNLWNTPGENVRYGEI